MIPVFVVALADLLPAHCIAGAGLRSRSELDLIGVFTRCCARPAFAPTIGGTRPSVGEARSMCVCHRGHMLIVQVMVHVKPEAVHAFKATTVANARQSVDEPGVARFDVIQQRDDPTTFGRCCLRP